MHYKILTISLFKKLKYKTVLIIKIEFNIVATATYKSLSFIFAAYGSYKKCSITCENSINQGFPVYRPIVKYGSIANVVRTHHLFYQRFTHTVSKTNIKRHF